MLLFSSVNPTLLIFAVFSVQGNLRSYLFSNEFSKFTSALQIDLS